MIEMNRDFLYKEYVDNKKSIKIISNETKIPVMTIYDAMVKFAVPIRKSKKFQIPRDVLYIEYIENSKTTDQISDIFGCSASVIQSLLKKYNIGARVGKNPNLISILTKELLTDLYINKNLRIREIALKLNFSERHIREKLKEFGIHQKRATKRNLQIDLTNKVFGKLTVISLDNISYDGYTWVCNCECGVQTKVLAGNLLDKNVPIRSCGCSRVLVNSDWKIIPPYQWNTIKTHAKNRGLPFTITKEYAEDLFLKQNKCCNLSGKELKFGRAKIRTETTASLDRIDSDIGYIDGNVQWVHKIVNIAKHTSKNWDFIEMCKLVAEFNK